MSFLDLSRSRPTSGRTLTFAAVRVDVLCIGLALFAALFGRAHLPFFEQPSAVGRTIAVVGPLISIGWIATIAAMGGYAPALVAAGHEERKLILRSGAIAMGLTAIISYLARFDLSRGFYFLIFSIGIPALFLGRLVLSARVRRRWRLGQLRQRVLMVGSRVHVDEVAAMLGRDRGHGYEIVGALVPRASRPRTPAGIPVLGEPGEVVDRARELHVSAIFFANGSLESAAELRRLAWELEDADVQLAVVPGLAEIAPDRVTVRPMDGFPLVMIDGPRARHAVRQRKRFFDLLGAALLVLALTPVLLGVAARIRLHDGGPVLFRQVRVGRDGRLFSCLKFRTMVTDAEARSRELHERTGRSALLFKLKEDPRITGPGRWIRRYSLDELPQLFNVLSGDMSLVGPRPQVPAEVALYRDQMSRRLHVRPGMTGLWQVSGRSDLSAEDAIRLDLYYVDNWSMSADATILARTVRAVLMPTGAY